ncbi:MAG TPA: hypothetical protein VEW93_13670 [Acidimicrobiales bacterium]|nr:hypothetical protein [Acidimicrobiales bacterium]
MPVRSPRPLPDPSAGTGGGPVPPAGPSAVLVDAGVEVGRPGPASCVPLVDDALGPLVEAAYRQVVGRAPTRAEKLSTVAGLQGDPSRVAALAELLVREVGAPPSAWPSSGPAWSS